jgi:HEAT repeat protein
MPQKKPPNRERSGGTDPDPVARAAELAALGLRARLPAGALARLTAACSDPDERVRAAALGALVRRATLAKAIAAWRTALDDSSPAVRRRAAELTAELARRRAVDAVDLATDLVSLLADPDVTVLEASAWSLGELGPAASAIGAVDALARVATGHVDALAREAAVAALGAIGDERGRAAVLAACDDKPAVRRRAVLALAPFEGPDVDAALARAAVDRDWQVRQSADDMQNE